MNVLFYVVVIQSLLWIVFAENYKPKGIKIINRGKGSKIVNPNFSTDYVDFFRNEQNSTAKNEDFDDLFDLDGNVQGLPGLNSIYDSSRNIKHHGNSYKDKIMTYHNPTLKPGFNSIGEKSNSLNNNNNGERTIFEKLFNNRQQSNKLQPKSLQLSQNDINQGILQENSNNKPRTLYDILKNKQSNEHMPFDFDEINTPPLNSYINADDNQYMNVMDRSEYHLPRNLVKFNEKYKEDTINSKDNVKTKLSDIKSRAKTIYDKLSNIDERNMLSNHEMNLNIAESNPNWNEIFNNMINKDVKEKPKIGNKFSNIAKLLSGNIKNSNIENNDMQSQLTYPQGVNPNTLQILTKLKNNQVKNLYKNTNSPTMLNLDILKNKPEGIYDRYYILDLLNKIKKKPEAIPNDIPNKNVINTVLSNYKNFYNTLGKREENIPNNPFYSELRVSSPYSSSPVSTNGFVYPCPTIQKNLYKYSQRRSTLPNNSTFISNETANNLRSELKSYFEKYRSYYRTFRSDAQDDNKKFMALNSLRSLNNLNSADQGMALELTYNIDLAPLLPSNSVYLVKYLLPYECFKSNLLLLLQTSGDPTTDVEEMYKKIILENHLSYVSDGLNSLSEKDLLTLVVLHGTLEDVSLLDNASTEQSAPISPIKDVENKYIFYKYSPLQPSGSDKPTEVDVDDEVYKKMELYKTINSMRSEQCPKINNVLPSIQNTDKQINVKNELKEYFKEFFRLNKILKQGNLNTYEQLEIAKYIQALTLKYVSNKNMAIEFLYNLNINNKYPTYAVKYIMPFDCFKRNLLKTILDVVNIPGGIDVEELYKSIINEQHISLISPDLDELTVKEILTLVYTNGRIVEVNLISLPVPLDNNQIYNNFYNSIINPNQRILLPVFKNPTGGTQYPNILQKTNAYPNINLTPYSLCPRFCNNKFNNGVPDILNSDITKPTNLILPNNIMPNNVDPGSLVLPNNLFPSNSVSDNIIAPNNIVPNNFVPHSIVPNTIVPNNLVPNHIVPNNIVPNGIVSNNIVPNNIVSNDISPSNIFPNNIIPSNIVPNNVIPNNIFQNNVSPSNVLPNNMKLNNILPSSVVPNDIGLYNMIPNKILPNNEVPNVLPNDFKNDKDRLKNYFDEYLQLYVILKLEKELSELQKSQLLNAINDLGNLQNKISGKAIELTYRINLPYPSKLAVKYRLPYNTFMKNMLQLLEENPNYRNKIEDLYKFAIPKQYVTSASPELYSLTEGDALNLVKNNGQLIGVLLINEGDDNLKDKSPCSNSECFKKCMKQREECSNGGKAENNLIDTTKYITPHYLIKNNLNNIPYYQNENEIDQNVIWSKYNNLNPNTPTQNVYNPYAFNVFQKQVNDPNMALLDLASKAKLYNYLTQQMNGNNLYDTNLNLVNSVPANNPLITYNFGTKSNGKDQGSLDKQAINSLWEILSQSDKLNNIPTNIIGRSSNSRNNEDENIDPTKRLLGLLLHFNPVPSTKNIIMGPIISDVPQEVGCNGYSKVPCDKGNTVNIPNLSGIIPIK